MAGVGLLLLAVCLAAVTSGNPAPCPAGECVGGGGGQVAVVSRQPSYSGADPCVPSPCGPNTRCDVNSRGLRVCRCLSGFFPKPDTVAGCGPQCISDGECGSGYVCRSQKCMADRTSVYTGTSGGGALQTAAVTGTSQGGLSSAVFSRNTGGAVADPCSLGLCGTNADCSNVNGRAVCSCPEGYEGNPLSACNRGECIDDSQCPALMTCLGVTCVNPCSRRPCGTSAECNVVNRRAICRCPVNYVGDPFVSCSYNPQKYGGGGTVQTYRPSGGVSDTRRFTSSFNQGTLYQGACNPSPCGVNTNCELRQGRAICSCIANYIGSPLSGCRPECSSDAHCASHQVCSQNHCRHACRDACGTGARCEAVNHRAICSCPQYYRGSGLTGCFPECTSHAECGASQACIQLRCGDPCVGSCGVGANCRVSAHTAVCSCPVGYGGHPYDRCVPPRSPVGSGTTGATSGLTTAYQANGAAACAEQTAGVFVMGGVHSGSLCSPNPCGALAECNPGTDRSGKARPVCTCPRGYVGNPLTACQRGECQEHSNCPANQACYNYSCTNPCVGQTGGSVCGINAECRPQGHKGICSCPLGYDGDPLTQCSRKPLAATDHRV